MASRNKKANEHIPFTQFWCNLSKQLQKQTKPHPKSTKASKSKYCESALLKPSLDEAISKQRRSSIGHMNKKVEQDSLNYQKIELPLQFKHKQNRFPNKSLLNETNYEQENSTHGINSNYMNSCFVKQKSYISSVHERKNNVSQKILKVFQCNVIPFLVDKFIEIEEKLNIKVKKLEQIVLQQKQQINLLKKNQNTFNQTINLMKTYLESQASKENQEEKDQGSKQSTKNYNKCKVLVEVGNSPIKFPESLKHDDELSIKDEISKQLTEQNEQNIRCFSKLLEQLTIAIEQSQIRTEQHIKILDNKVKKLSEKQKIGEQKMEEQFAQKILQLISTYNDNFVDLDKRIGNVEQILHQNKQKPLKYLARAVTVPDKQKTYRYN